MLLHCAAGAAGQQWGARPVRLAPGGHPTAWRSQPSHPHGCAGGLPPCRSCWPL